MSIRRLNPDEREKIRQAVVAAELTTSGEIVSMIVPSSYAFSWVSLGLALLGWVLASMALSVFSVKSPFTYSASEAIYWQGLAISFGFVLGSLESIARLIVPKKWLEQAVHRNALGAFSERGLYQTRDRTGILIYISLAEHRVEILADSGINAKVPAGYWQAQVDELVKGIREGKGVEALCAVIAEVGQKLSANFPRRADDQNELSDEVRAEDPS